MIGYFLELVHTYCILVLPLSEAYAWVRGGGKGRYRVPPSRIEKRRGTEEKKIRESAFLYAKFGQNILSVEGGGGGRGEKKNTKVF